MIWFFHFALKVMVMARFAANMLMRSGIMLGFVCLVQHGGFLGNWTET